MFSSTPADARWTARAALIAGALLTFGCDGDDACEEEDHSHDTCGLQANCTDTVELEEGLSVESEDGKFTVAVLSREPLSVEENLIAVAIENADGDRVTDAELEVSVFSVDCMHPGPTPPDAISAEADGSYELTPVHAHGGPWDTVIEIAAGGETDTARLHFCVPGDEHSDAGTHDDHDDDRCH
jgi:hypothetical protein